MQNLATGLAAIESLVNYARAEVSLRKGDSGYLHRAELDLDQALRALAQLRVQVMAGKPDPAGEFTLMMGKMAVGIIEQGTRQKK